MSKPDRKLLDKLFRDNTPIEVGWTSFRDSIAHPDSSQRQLDDMRKLFFSGALHVWCIIGECIGDKKSNRKYAAINAELAAFAKRMLAEHAKREK